MQFTAVGFVPEDVFDLIANPAQWWQPLKLNGYVNKGPFVLHDRIFLVLNNQDVLIDKAMSKSTYGE